MEISFFQQYKQFAIIPACGLVWGRPFVTFGISFMWLKWGFCIKFKSWKVKRFIKKLRYNVRRWKTGEGNCAKCKHYEICKAEFEKQATGLLCSCEFYDVCTGEFCDRKKANKMTKRID